MALSEQEQRVLEEIENALRQEDAHFGRSFEDPFASQRRPAPMAPLRAIALVALGLVILVAGIVLAPVSLWFVSLSIAGFLLMLGAGVWGLRKGNTAPSGHNSAANRFSSSKGAPKSKDRAHRMEENFRRRFER